MHDRLWSCKDNVWYCALAVEDREEAVVPKAEYEYEISRPAPLNTSPASPHLTSTDSPIAADPES